MYYQQGDILIKKIDGLSKGKIEKYAKFVLAEGEVTGHCHTMVGDLSVVKDGDKTFVKIEGQPAEIIHQEHNLVIVDPGIYEIEKVLEYDHFEEEAKRIVD